MHPGLKLTLRYWKQHPGGACTLVAILALGVATFLAIHLANRAALASFSGFSTAISGGSDHTIRALAGELDTDDLQSVQERLSQNPVHILPFLETPVVRPRSEDDPIYGRENYKLLGVDLMAAQNLDRGDQLLRGENGDLPDAPDLMQTPLGIIITPAMATNLNLKRGDHLTLIPRDKPVALEVIGILPDDPRRLPLPENLILMDLPSLQALIERPDAISRIELIEYPALRAAYPDSSYILKPLQENQPVHWKIESQAESSGDASATAGMTQAFRLNLLVLSLIALLVGVYLIIQALDASVVRRRQEIAILRSLGMTRKQIQRIWLAESALLGVVGSTVGLVFAVVLAQGFVLAVSRTVNALYTTASATAAGLSAEDIWIAYAIGVPASIIGGWLPARDAATTPPAQAMQAGAVARGFRLFDRPAIGLGLIAAGVVCYFLPPVELSGGSRFPLAGYAAAFLWLIGGTLVAAFGFNGFGYLKRRCHTDSAAMRFGLGRLAQSASRHKLTAAGLFVAVAMAGGMSLLVSSFEYTMKRWIEQRFQADVYIASEGAQSADALNKVRPETVAALLGDPEVEAADVFQSFPIELEGKPTFVSGADVALLREKDAFIWIEAPGSNELPLQTGQLPVLANETFAARFELSVGDTVAIPTPSGTVEGRLAGIYADYGNDRGSLLMDISESSRLFKNAGATNLSVFLARGVSPAAWVDRWSSIEPGLSFRTNADLRQSILRIFRQTFSVTEAVKGIGITVALAGLALGLVSIIRESHQQYETLERLGMPRQQAAIAGMWEGAGITAVGLFTGLIAAFGLGRLLVFVINRQSFGWTLAWHTPWLEITLLSLAVLISGTGVAYLTARSTIKGLAKGSRVASQICMTLLVAGACTIVSGNVNANEPPAFNAEGWRLPQPGTKLEFPRAHGSHPDYKTEWWYYVGRLQTAKGERFGFQATFFRHGQTPPMQRDSNAQIAFGRNHLYIAHMALTDIDGQTFRFEKRIHRDGWAASASTETLDLVNGDWSLRLVQNEPEVFAISATIDAEVALRLTLSAQAPRIRFGEDGLSRKGSDPGATSYYISFAQLAAEGTLQLAPGDEPIAVTGLAWMDHEISSNQLSEELVGWDWTAIQLDNGEAVKAYILRNEDGTPSEWSRLIWIIDNQPIEYGPERYTWRPTQFWESPHTGGRYPIGVEISTTHPVSGQPVSLRLVPLLDDQELYDERGDNVAYWEGACTVESAEGKRLGQAYLELTGYAEPLNR